MKYKTTINIVSEARNRDEAIDIVEEYLSGNIRSGVDMKCATGPERTAVKVTCAVALSLVIVGVIIFPIHLKTPQLMVPNVSAISAVQAPLKTDRKNVEFKKEWETRQTKEAIEYIKR
jgi:hypothetical protein